MVAALDPAVGAMYVASIAAIASIINTIISNRTKKSVGKKNGQGDLVEMNERQLRQHSEVKAELAVIKDLIVSHVTDVEAHGSAHGSVHRLGDRRAR